MYVCTYSVSQNCSLNFCGLGYYKFNTNIIFGRIQIIKLTKTTIIGFFMGSLKANLILSINYRIAKKSKIKNN